MILWTNDILVSARRIYEAAGFSLIERRRTAVLAIILLGSTGRANCKANYGALQARTGAGDAMRIDRRFQVLPGTGRVKTLRWLYKEECGYQPSCPARDFLYGGSLIATYFWIRALTPFLGSDTLFLSAPTIFRSARPSTERRGQIVVRTE